MYQTNLNQRSLRSALLLGAASAAAIGIAAPASAQPVETVVVTGSRIPQTGVYAASPVTAVGQQELKFEGTTDVSTLINNLPEAFVGQTANMANGSVGTATGRRQLPRYAYHNWTIRCGFLTFAGRTWKRRSPGIQDRQVHTNE